MKKKLDEAKHDPLISTDFKAIFFTYSLTEVTVRTAHFSKKSLWSDVGEIKKMSTKFKKKSGLTLRNSQEKSNTVLSMIYYKTPPKHRHRRLYATK
jgi:hypothetical protein